MASHEEIRKKREQLTDKTFLMALQILAIFGVPAFVAYHVGGAVNEKTNIAPHGYTIAFVVSFVFSWAIVIRMYRKVVAEFKKLDQQEAALMDARKNQS